MSYPNDPLPTKQRQCLEAIIAFIDANGYAPTRAEIAVVMKCHDTNVYKMMQALEYKGYITRVPNVRRSIKVVKRAS